MAYAKLLPICSTGPTWLGNHVSLFGHLAAKACRALRLQGFEGCLRLKRSQKTAEAHMGSLASISTGRNPRNPKVFVGRDPRVSMQ